MGDYDDAVALQQLRQGIERVLKETPVKPPFGPADEKCPHCGGPIEVLLDTNGRNPERRCWRCDAE